MNPLDAPVELFAQTFGTTQPDDVNRRRAGWLILGLMTLAIALLVTVGIVGFNKLHAPTIR